MPTDCLQGFRKTILVSCSSGKGRFFQPAAKRAPTFQINVAVTNFAPERIVSDKRGSAADKCIRIETYTWHSRQLRYRGRKIKPSNDKHKEKEKYGEGEGCSRLDRRALVLQEAHSCAGTG